MAILTISREHGTGGEFIGRLIAERLQYRYVDKETLYQEIAKSGPRWERSARELDEVCPTFWERHDWEYRGYVALMESKILDYAAADRAVIVGRAGSILLSQVPFCLRVRLIAPLEIRIQRLMEREKLALKAARRLIKQLDRDRAGYYKVNYGVSWKKEEGYDMTINTASLSFEQVADNLMAALAEKDLLVTPAAKNELDHLALAYRLKARLATEPRLFIPTLRVKLEAEVIKVSGIVHIPQELELAQKIAQEVCGEFPFRLNLQHRF